MNKQEYKEYQEAVKDFFEREGINCLSYDVNEYPEGNIEPHFSWSSCDCCGDSDGGNREICSGYNPTTKEVQSGYSICEDCVYYVEYGQLDDTTMINIEESED